MEDNGQDLYDYSTFLERFQGRSRHWSNKHYLLAILVIPSAVLLIMTVLQSTATTINSSLTAPVAISSKLQNRIDATEDSELDFVNDLENLDISNALSLQKIRIRNTEIDAPKFSNSLKAFATKVREIHLENVTISGQFSKLYLPALSVFVLKLSVPESESNHLEIYQDPTRVHSYFFFNKIQGQNWDIIDVANLGIDITYEVDGFTFLHVNKTRKELTIYVPNCDKILSSTSMRIETLSIASCAIQADSVPDTVEYLNFFDVEIKDGHVRNILSKTKRLRHLFLDMPNTSLDLTDLPPTLETLSLATLTLTNKNNPPTFQDLKSVSFGFTDITDDVYVNFATVFPHVQQVAAIGLQVANYKFLETCVKFRIPSIMLQEFYWDVTEEENNLNKFLAGLGIGPEEIRFELLLPIHSDEYIGSVLPEEVADAYRYDLLGWYKFLSVTAYISAEKYMI